MTSSRRRGPLHPARSVLARLAIAKSLRLPHLKVVGDIERVVVRLALRASANPYRVCGKHLAIRIQTLKAKPLI